MAILATEYTIVSADDVNTLTKKVNERLKTGWHPHGSLQCAVHLDTPVFMQPMLKGTSQHSYLVDSLDAVVEKLETVGEKLGSMNFYMARGLDEKNSPA